MLLLDTCNAPEDSSARDSSIKKGMSKLSECRSNKTPRMTQSHISNLQTKPFRKQQRNSKARQIKDKGQSKRVVGEYKHQKSEGS